MLDVIGQARESIDLAAYYLTSKSTAQALAEAAERGVSVRVVADKKPIVHAIPPPPGWPVTVFPFV